MSDLKTCKKCHTAYPGNLDFFPKEPKAKSGISGTCLVCRRKEAVDRKHGRHPAYRNITDKSAECTSCKIEKPHTEEFFAPNKKCRGGLEPQCRECRTKMRHARRPPTNKDIPRKDGFIWCPHCQEMHPANLEWFGRPSQKSISQICRQGRRVRSRRKPTPKDGYKICGTCKCELIADLENFPPKPTGGGGVSGTCRRCSSSKQAVYYQRNRERLVRLSLDWTRRNPEKARANFHNYRARKRAAPGKHSAEDIIRQHRNQDGKCFWCQQELKVVNGRRYHVDHFIPLSRGGGNGPDNIVCACAPCNGRKHNKMPWEFMPDRFSPPDPKTAD